MKRTLSLTIIASVLALGLFAAMPSSASAQWGYGGYNRGYGGYNRGYGGYHQGYGNYGGGWGHGRYHDTSHWDYHPTTIVPHGNHFHVQPGHYDWHQTGHFHGGRGGYHRH